MAADVARHESQTPAARVQQLTPQTIKCLLIYPNPESALDEEAGKQLLADYEGYCKVRLCCGPV